MNRRTPAQTIKAYMDSVAQTDCVADKITITNEMVGYIANFGKDLLSRHHKFKRALKDRIVHFNRVNNIAEATLWWNKLFYGEPLD